MWIVPVPSCTSLRSSSIGNVEPSLRRPTVSATRPRRPVRSCSLGLGVAGEVGRVLGRDHHRERLPDRLLLAVAEQLGRRAVERLDHAVVAERDDAVRDVLEHRAGARLAVAELLAERTRSELARLEEELDEDRDLRAQDAGTIGAKMKSTAPLA